MNIVPWTCYLRCEVWSAYNGMCGFMQIVKRTCGREVHQYKGLHGKSAYFLNTRNIFSKSLKLIFQQLFSKTMFSSALIVYAYSLSTHGL